jgi:hypothetical protein
MVVIQVNLAENRRLASQAGASIATNLPNLTTPELYTCDISDDDIIVLVRSPECLIFALELFNTHNLSLVTSFYSRIEL